MGLRCFPKRLTPSPEFISLYEVHSTEGESNQRSFTMGYKCFSDDQCGRAERCRCQGRMAVNKKIHPETDSFVQKKPASGLFLLTRNFGSWCTNHCLYLNVTPDSVGVSTAHWYSSSVRLETAYMCINRITDVFPGLVKCLSPGMAARERRHICMECFIFIRFYDDAIRIGFHSICILSNSFEGRNLFVRLSIRFQFR